MREAPKRIESAIPYTIPRWAKFARPKPPFTEAETHRLVFHGLDVASVLESGFARNPALVGRLAALLGMEPGDTRAMMLTLTALHDIGKVLASFQLLQREAMEQVGLVIRHEPRRYCRETAGHDAAGWVLFWALREAQSGGKLSDVLPADCMTADADTFKVLVTAFTGHHGHPRQATWKDIKDYANPEADLAAAADFVRSMVAHYGWRQGFPTPEAAERASYLINGLVTLCDWLGSADDFRPRSADMPVAAYVAEHARPTADAVLDRVQPAIFASPAATPAQPFTELFAALNPGGVVTPSPMQACCEHLFDEGATGDGPLLLVIEDMTGTGKTEAGDYAGHRLVAAGRAHGIYAGLPTTTTADQGFLRRDAFFDRLWSPRIDRVLAHGRSDQARIFTSTAERGDVEAGNADCVDWFARSSRTALLAMAGVGTVDQALLAGLRANYAGLRLVGLWGKVLVVDEVHAYDGYMLAVLEKLLEAHARHGGSAVLMSATLPSGERAKLVTAFLRGLGQETKAEAVQLHPFKFPALTVVHGGAEPRLVEVRRTPGPGALERVFARVGSAEAAAAAVLDHAAAGRSVVWFRNTVDQARDAYDGLLEEARRRGLPDPILWHARFLPGHRAVIERSVLDCAERKSGPAQRRSRIVVATQVGEQSLDLDFDALVTDLAPIDAMIQRIGRSRRHRRDAEGRAKPDGADERPNPPITILAPDPDPDKVKPGWYEAALRGAACIYPDEARLWLGLTHLLCPETLKPRTRTGPIVLDHDLKPLIESVYAEKECVKPRVPEPFRLGLDAAEGGEKAFRQVGCKNRLSFTKGLLGDCTEEPGTVISDDGAFVGAPTRLGESYTLVLAYADESGIRLAGDEAASQGARPHDPIAASEIRTRWRLKQSSGEAAKESLAPSLTPQQQKRLAYATLVLLRPEGDGWTGVAREDDGSAEGGREVRLCYCARRGLVIEPAR